MKKRSSIITVYVCAIMLIGCGGGGVLNKPQTNGSVAADDLPRISWRMASTWGEGNSHFTVDLAFTRILSELTNGKFIIKNYAAGTLGASGQIFDMVQNGTVECAGDWAGFWSGKNSGFDPLGTTMDNFSAMDYFIWCYQGGGLKDAYQYMYNKYGLQYFPIIFHSAESGFRGTKPIAGIKDLKGAKIRLGGKIQGIVAQQLGFTPVTIDSTELYEALQRGVVDAAEFSVPTSDLSLKLHEVAKFWWTPGWHQSAGCNGVMVNMDKWNALPAAYRDAFEKATQLCVAESMARYNYEDFLSTKEMIESGVQICFYPEEDLRVISDLVKAATAQMAAENPDYAHVIASMNAYRKLADPYREILGKYSFGYAYDEYSLEKVYPGAVYKK